MQLGSENQMRRCRRTEQTWQQGGKEYSSSTREKQAERCQAEGTDTETWGSPRYSLALKQADPGSSLWVAPGLGRLHMDTCVQGLAV